MKYDNFINIEFSAANLDRYFVRQSILEAIKNNLEKFNGQLLDIGCGKMPYKEYMLEHSPIRSYVGLDIETALEYDSNVQPDFTWDGVTMPFDNNEFETAFGTEVLEHCPKPEIILKEIHRVLKPGGVFFFTVPFLWPLHETPHDEYRYTPYAMTRMLEEVGFGHAELKATGGWHASLAQMLGLWVRRSSLTIRRRKILSALLKPLIKYLIKKDQDLPIEFKEGQMITGLCGVAYKK